MRKILLVLLLLVGFAQVRAQHIFDLFNVDPVAIPSGIHIDSVIVTLDDTASIGTVMKGLGNRPVPAFLDGGVKKNIRGLLRNGPDSAGEVHCVLRVHVLRIAETITPTREFGSCALDLDLLVDTDSGWVRYFRYGSSVERTGGLDATSKHGDNIRNALAKGMAYFEEVRRNGLLQPRLLPITGPGPAFQEADEERKAWFQVRGVYWDFMDFREDRPDTAVRFESKLRNKDDFKIKLAKLKFIDKVNKAAPWGFCDGKHLFVNIGNEYLRMEHEGTDFLGWYQAPASFGPPGAGEVIGTVAASMVYGMMAGGVLLVFPLGTVRTGGAVSVTLDQRTGVLWPTPRPEGSSGEGDTAPTSDHLFVFSRNSSLDGPVDMYVYGGLECRLHKDEHHYVQLVPRAGLVPVELKVGDGEPVSIEISTERTGGDPEVYLVKVDKEGKPKVDRLNAQMASSIIGKLDPEREVK